MKKINTSINFCISIAKFQTELSRRLDARLNGIGFNELIILYHLSLADGAKMRRIDLAEKLGLTASGITRLLLPMEKIGLIKKEANEHDARVSYVVLAPGGKTKLSEGMERMEIYCEEIIPENKIKKLEEFSGLLREIKI
ncbi:MAG: Transcriptional regulator, MarR family [Candidatus Falkowbacteria bacterium GW2011_GWC2_38_22]|uniref:Transcriptional regulator, MarR family n=1 Tax=Candidatus Falkowbacteria bacterium GW2011_GWE1_38_31 TaxID=1618638 RepID=A0A0G0MAK4_9BACT|nr:MAG: Transcriptional regulator, MarR family [Candidatus Falkowbacteria bacterium GW2011_GWF2_38_1205]KKQ61914.1 MAG: Transcriptional regulator, MarR family [Candidatus Falkowbacteria bacterium GW2011_GWC2_38_22]KKQ63924.1 MAG: Transcriptional regulator, MarR family [Candidatus Falkowbacteria bacterium GW2011_GWF1_38_22]KKQ66181.1 MAG: Transcriptional regulator, MarR family [Candidatus Falkowbacteria bacterium GW2011_GWE2_38_254]KKQ70784.1 MAG: Transcriptional regulator, MarR family [Candidat